MWQYGGRENAELVLKARFWPLVDARELSHLLMGMRMADDFRAKMEMMNVAAEGLRASYCSCPFFRLIQLSWHHRMFTIPSAHLIAPVNGILMGCTPNRCEVQRVRPENNLNMSRELEETRIFFTVQQHYFSTGYL